MQVGDRLPGLKENHVNSFKSRSSFKRGHFAVDQHGYVGQSKVGRDFLNNYQQRGPVIKSYKPISNLMSEDPAHRFDVQEARIILEGGTTWYAAQRATQEILVNIRHHYDQINHFQALGNDDEAARADAKFHLAIAEASHNLVLIR